LNANGLNANAFQPVNLSQSVRAKFGHSPVISAELWWTFGRLYFVLAGTGTNNNSDKLFLSNHSIASH
jgi:hypothetical protein